MDADNDLQSKNEGSKPKRHQRKELSAGSPSELTSGFGEGNEEWRKRFQMLWDKYSPETMRIARWRLGNDDDAKDASQNCWLKVWKKFDQLRNQNSPLTWILRILENACYDILKQNCRRIGTGNSLYEDVVAPEEDDWQQRLGALKRAKVRLAEERPDLARVVGLSEEQDLSREDIAVELECDVKTVYIKLRDAKTLLRKYLREAGWDEVPAE